MNGLEVDEPAVPVVYEPILKQYRTALKENWNGQQLVDAGLNFMIVDCKRICQLSAFLRVESNV